MEKKRALPIVIVVLLLIPFVGGLYWYVARTGRQMSAKEREDDLVKPLMDAKEVTLSLRGSDMESRVRIIAQADRQSLIDCLDDATLEPNALKWEAVGSISMTDASGADATWYLYSVTGGELAFKNENRQYWRGVRKTRIARLVAEE